MKLSSKSSRFFLIETFVQVGNENRSDPFAVFLSLCCYCPTFNTYLSPGSFLIRKSNSEANFWKADANDPYCGFIFIIFFQFIIRNGVRHSQVLKIIFKALLLTKFLKIVGPVLGWSRTVQLYCFVCFCYNKSA